MKSNEDLETCQQDESLSAEHINSSRQPSMADPLIGQVFAAKYKILELIGTGGWGNVYRGTHLHLGTDIAIKVLHKHLAEETVSLKRLEQEAKLLSQLNNPFIVRILDYAPPPVPYIVMEYFEGTPLNKRLKNNGPLDAGAAIELFMQMCEGLSAAHALGLVHRDLKPSNILLKLEPDGILKSKIVDFGIAKLISEINEQERITSTGEVLGSPAYMSPEQWSGRSEHLSDIYALGCIMYEVMSGKPAFKAHSSVDYLNLHISSDPPPIHRIAPQSKIPADLEDVLRKCLQKKPEDRYESCAAINQDLMQIKAGKRIKISLPGELRRTKKLAASLLVFLIAASTGLFWLERKPIVTYACLVLNSQADRDATANSTESAIQKYRQSLLLAEFLGKQDKSKLHAMRMLSKLLKKLNSLPEAEFLDTQINEIIGVPGTELQRALSNVRYERDVNANLSMAEAHARQALTEATKSYGYHSLAVSDALNELAIILRRQMLYKDSVEMHKDSLRIAEDLLEPDDLIIAKRLNELGFTLIFADQVSEAKSLLERSVNISARQNDIIDNTLSLANLGNAYLQVNDYKSALDSLYKALKLCPKEETSELSRIWTRLGYVYLAKHDNLKAIDCLNKGLELRKKAGVFNEPDSEHQLSNLGVAYSNLKDYAKAEKYFEQALKMRIDSDPRHPRLPKLFSFLMDVKLHLGKNDEAEKLKLRYYDLFGKKWHKGE